MQNSAELVREIRQLGLRVVLSAVGYTLRTRWVEAKYADPEHPQHGFSLLAAFIRSFSSRVAAFPPFGPVTATPGKLVSHTRRGQELVVEFESGEEGVHIALLGVLQPHRDGRLEIRSSSDYRTL